MARARLCLYVALLAASAATPARAQDEKDEAVQAVFSAGVAYLQDDHEDFTKAGGALLVSNDSKSRASGLAGALFRIGDITLGRLGKKQVSVLASFQFTQGTPSLLDGVMFGGSLELNDHLHVSTGVGLRKGKELSPGFRSAAADVIRTQVAANNAAYRRFEAYDGTQNEESVLDGLPLNAPGSEKPFFPGEPIVDSYNWSWFVGVTVPVKIADIFKK
jgi:hypothetical protein